MSAYWQRFTSGFPVSMPGLSPSHRNWVWFGIYGIQIGNWFFGAIKGNRAPNVDECACCGRKIKGTAPLAFDENSVWQGHPICSDACASKLHREMNEVAR